MADNYLKLQKENNLTDEMNDRLKKELNKLRSKLELQNLDLDKIKRRASNFEVDFTEQNQTVKGLREEVSSL